MIIYQLLPRLFGSNKKANIKNGTIDQNGCGKFRDITNTALTELKTQGYTHIWYTGIIEHAQLSNYSQFNIEPDNPLVVKGKAGSPYAIKDYYDVDPDLAIDVPHRMSEFEALIQRTHSNKLNVIIDFVPNHLARHYKSDAKPDNITDFGEDDDLSMPFLPQNNFYYIPGRNFVAPIKSADKDYKEFPARVTGNDCFTESPSINDWFETVKLNYGVDYEKGRIGCFKPIPNTWYKMTEILQYWAAKGVDGFRCDMAEMVPVEFWQWAIQHVKRDYPNVTFIAEVYNPEFYRDYLYKGGFDYLYDKVGIYDNIRGVIEGHKSIGDISKAWQKIDGIQDRMLFFMENHDEQRIASDYFAKDPFIALPGVLLSATMYKNPFMVYFGQELGEPGMDEEGFSGRDGRTSIFDYWSVDKLSRWANAGKFNQELLTKDEISLQNWYTELLNLVNEAPALKDGQFYDLTWYNLNNSRYHTSKVYSFLRYTQNQVLLIVINFDDKPKELRIKIPEHAFNLSGLSGKTYLKGSSLFWGNIKVQFPREVAQINGIGIKLAPHFGTIIDIS